MIARILSTLGLLALAPTLWAAGAIEGGLDVGWPLRASTNSALGDLHVHARVAARF